MVPEGGRNAHKRSSSSSTRDISEMRVHQHTDLEAATDNTGVTSPSPSTTLKRVRELPPQHDPRTLRIKTLPVAQGLDSASPSGASQETRAAGAHGPKAFLQPGNLDHVVRALLARRASPSRSEVEEEPCTPVVEDPLSQSVLTTFFESKKRISEASSLPTDRVKCPKCTKK
ncbi:hypothetical protein T484DRAFT_1753085 [Baffinella frigidus]|nr:hypothetical protein T484DRAFT_1753085 [Cryptophyta sp. CCMP2293]